MNVVEMRNSRKTSQVAFLDFSQLKNKLISQGKKVIFFFEGTDDIKYYRKRINKFFERSSYHYFEIKGKSNVLELKDKLKFTKELKLIYFIDRDFDNNIQESDLYVTPYYSIENFYISKEVFKNYLNDTFLSQLDNEEEFDKILNLYIERKREFLDSLDEFMFFYFYNWYFKKNLGQLNELDNFIKVKLNKIEKKYDISILKKKVTDAEEKMDNQDILFEFDKIKSNRIAFYRGKFLFYFLEKFIIQLKTDYTSKIPKYFVCQRALRSINTQELLFEMADWSETPKCLDEFLKNIKIS